MEKYEQIMEELGDLLGVSLESEGTPMRRLAIQEKFILQFEPSRESDDLFIIAIISEIPPGKFREKVLKAALKENENASYDQGIMGFIETQNLLSMHVKYPLRGAKAEKILELLPAFLEKAESWYDALQVGRAGPNTSDIQSDDKPPQFGMKM